jgi:hypothetical protein
VETYITSHSQKDGNFGLVISDILSAERRRSPNSHPTTFCPPKLSSGWRSTSESPPEETGQYCKNLLADVLEGTDCFQESSYKNIRKMKVKTKILPFKIFQR